MEREVFDFPLCDEDPSPYLRFPSDDGGNESILCFGIDDDFFKAT